MTPAATRLPLLVLGHPGAGKSLLTKVFAARLPAAMCTAIRVPLREVDADAPVVEQIQQALDRATNRRVDWPRLVEQSAATIRVILIDGLDELLQATAFRRAGYLHEVTEFQRLEAEQDQPVVVVAVLVTLPGEPAAELLFALLSHVPLSVRRPILGFVAEMFSRLPAPQRDLVNRSLSVLLTSARAHRPPEQYDGYRPVPVDQIRRMAAYCANLLLLRVQLASGGAPVAELDPAAEHLWRAGLGSPIATPTICGRASARPSSSACSYEYGCWPARSSRLT